LSPGARYEQVMEAFGGKGYRVSTREELKLAFQACLQSKQQAALVNVVINPLSGRKTQEFHWLTSKIWPIHNCTLVVSVDVDQHQRIVIICEFEDFLWSVDTNWSLLYDDSIIYGNW